MAKRKSIAWSMAEGCFPWWKVEVRTANAWTWFMLTLNWSCNIRARSSHIFARVSSLLKMAVLFRYRNNQTDPTIPTTINILRSTFRHFPAPLGDSLTCWCCFLRSKTHCWWSNGWFDFGCFLFHNFRWKPDIFWNTITSRRTQKHPINKLEKFFKCFLKRQLSTPACSVIW